MKKIPLSELLKLFNWYAFKKTDYKESGIFLLRQTNLDWMNISKNKAVYVDKKFLEEKKEFLLKKWDVLIWMSWSIGKYCIYDSDEQALQNQRVWKLIFFHNDIFKYVLHYLPLLETKLKNKAKWVAVLNISWKDFETLEIPLFSLPTQKRIVSEIEKQFSRLDEWLVSLKRTKENLKKYKASVLKSAVEWKLTEDFRKTQKLESASILLKQILEEKKNKFLSENPGKKYKEPEGIKQDDLLNIELPEGWLWCNLEHITSKITDWTHKTPKYIKEEEINWREVIKFISAKNIKDYKLTIQNFKYILKEEHNELNKKIQLEKWDVFIAKSWSIGQSTVFYLDEEYSIFESLAILKIVNKSMSEYVCLFVNSDIWQKQIKSKSKWVAVQHLHLEDVRKLQIPLPPLLEQNQIVKMVEEKLSVVEKLEKIVNENMKKTENLKQSILKKAFEWRLVEVPENEDEEVKKMLDEIKSDKIKIEKEAKKWGRMKK